MKKITKANMAKFVKAMTAYFLELGAVEEPSGIQNFKRFEIETSYGLLQLNIDTDSQLLYTIFGKFENVDIVKDQPFFKGVGNQYSGKYNFHASSNKTVEDAINDAKIFFNSKDLKNKHFGCIRGYHRNSKAWYSSSLDLESPNICIGMYHPEGGTSGEFEIKWENLQGKSCARLKSFEDSWSALMEFQDLLAVMKSIDGQLINEPEFCKILDKLNIKDLTKYQRD